MKQNLIKKNKNSDKLKSLYRSKPVIVEGLDVVKRYATEKVPVDALKGIDIVVREGEIVAIVGPSGCGKSTLLNCLSGIDEVDRGNVFFNGEELSRMTDGERTKSRAKEMGFIFQSFNLIPVLSAVENVELPMLTIGGNPREAREKALELLREVGLEDRANHKPNELSGGEKQRVAIARSLINSPKVIWADEPTGNLDSVNTEAVLKLILDLNKTKGTTFVIITHDLNIAMKAHRIVRMDSGKVIS